MIKSVYIVSKSGEPLYFYDFEKAGEHLVEDATLFSGMISAIRGFLTEMEIGEVTSFETDRNHVYINPVDDLVYILIVDKSHNLSDENIQKLLHEISEKIIINYDNGNRFIVNQENQMINQMITMVYDSWSKEKEETKAAKKIQDELW